MTEYERLMIENAQAIKEELQRIANYLNTIASCVDLNEETFQTQNHQ